MRSFIHAVGLALALVLGSGPATAGIPPVSPQAPSGAPACLCAEERAALGEWRDRIAAAPSLEAARELALSRARLARRALRGARWLAPGSPSIARAHSRLVNYEARVVRSESPAQAAAEFGELVQLASFQGPVLSDVEIDLTKDGDGCEYSTGEIIAIVLGFILGILPGIILLILLC